jgi:UDP-hydrolysing UDP-N-acetyl-D-glucosamine 2-epimerase
MGKRKVCVFTGTRAEYGLLRPLIKRIKESKELELQLLVSGMHLSPEFGLTYKEIQKDGFEISDEVEILLSSDTPVGTAKSIGLGILGFADSLKRLCPDIVVVLGDRFEALAMAISAYTLKIPVAHIHGGEITEGALDEGFRHAITKLSYLHFTATASYRRRVIQMGEDPSRVFNVGALALDAIREMELLPKGELQKLLNFEFGEKNILVTFHPETFSADYGISRLKNLLKVLEELEDIRVIFTKANADPGGREINRLLEEFVRKHPHRMRLFSSLGQKLYFSVMRFVDAVVGNSSSGIVEAPFFKIGTINIGLRQRGRIKPESVIDVSGSYEEIKRAFETLYSPSFQRRLKNIKNPYGDGRASFRIREILERTDLSTPRKRFFDWEVLPDEI